MAAVIVDDVDAADGDSRAVIGVVPSLMVPAFVTLMKPVKRNAPSSRLVAVPTNDAASLVQASS